MKSLYIYIALFVFAFIGSLQSVQASIYPIVISEVFYDTPLEEDQYAPDALHNGEFIEFFNPTSEEVNLGGWKLTDGSTTYYFPANTIIPARGTIIVAYQYPNSGFKLGDLFTQINSTNSQYVLYQSSIILNNDGEEISLYNNNEMLIDEMSYHHPESDKTGWDLNASNGNYRESNIMSKLSLQRTGIHSTLTSITPLAADYETATATPLQTYNAVASYPEIETLYDYDEINTGNEIGSLPGKSSVTPTGAATYQVPIEIPAGTNGMQPSLSVVYNSQGGFGMLGQGWDISGLSVISRGTEDFYHDAKNGKLLSTSIEFNSNDKLNLDGQRLIFIGEESDYYFQDGGEYATEAENYSRVKVKNSNVTGKIYFELTTKEGNIAEYGNTTDAIVTNASGTNDGKILAWRINKITDVNGNVVEYKYSDYGQYPSKITYNNTEIDFTFETNDLNPKQRYISTFLTKQDKLLKSITTYQNSGKIKTYDFGYLTSDMDYRLDNISLTASDGKKLNPTKIKWGNESKIQRVSVDKMWDGNLNNAANSHLYSGDIDGDGYADRIEMWGGSQSTSELGYIAVTLKGNKTLPLMRFIPVNLINKVEEASLLVGDINNDGRDEIVLIFGQVKDVATSDIYEQLISNGVNVLPPNGVNVLGINSDNSELKKLQLLEYSGKPNNDGYIPLLLNFNNDKYVDLMIIPYKNERFIEYGSNEISYFYGSENGFGSKQTYSSDKYYIGVSYPIIGDFNADGIIDVFRTNYNWIAGKGSNDTYKYNDSKYQSISSDIYYTEEYLEFYLWGNETPSFEELYSTDYNNDGLSDILVRQGITSDKKWKVLKNKGGYFKFDKQDLNIHNFSRTYEPEGDYAIPIDYNGDGLMDMIIADDWRNTQYGKMDYEDYEKTYWYFYKNIGGKYVLDGEPIGGNRYFYDDGTDFAGLSRMNPVVMDINGDGVQDLVFGDRQGDRDKRYYQAFTMPKANQRNVVQSITDGMGTEEKFTYTYFLNYNQEVQNATNPVRNLKAPIMLVGTYTDGLGRVTTYSYSNPKIHTEGKGFLGFETVTASNSTSKIVSTSTYEYDKTFYNVSLKHQETKTTSGTIISSLDITNTTKQVSGLRYMPLVTSQTAVDYLKNITQKTTNVYNSDGTLASQEVVTGNGVATALTEYSNYKKRTSNGLVAYLPQTIKVTNKRLGVSTNITNTTNITYTDKGQVNTKTENVGLYGETLTTYTYYAKGNVNTVTVKPKGINATITSYFYTGDSYYIYPTNVKSSTGGITLSDVSYTYDYTTGNVKTKTDNILNQTVTSEYNSFGRKTKETLPNNTYNTVNVTWNSSHTNSVYRIVTQTSANNSFTATYYDKFGREVYNETSGWNGKLLESSKTYNTRGQLSTEYLPHYSGETVKHISYLYETNLANRLTSIYNFDGVNMLYTTYTNSYQNNTSSVKTPNGQTKTTTWDAAGTIIKVQDGGGSINYTSFNANGQPLTITSNGATITLAYDEMGQKKSLTDPNTGTIQYSYCSDGQLDTQTSAKGDVTKMAYDPARRPLTKTITNVNGGTPTTDQTTYAYVANGNNGAGQVSSIEQKYDGVTNHKQVFTYNSHHQMATVADTYEGVTYTTTYGYDALWRQNTTTSPSGLVTTDVYNAYGDVYQVKAGTITVWEGTDQNSAGQWLKYKLGNGLQTVKTYTNSNLLTSINTGVDNSGTNSATIQNMVYTNDPKTYNLTTRNDVLHNRNETFIYDDLDRLLEAHMTGNATNDLTMNYKPNGNIDTKSDVGTYQYNNGLPNAMSGITGVQAGVSTDKQFIDYTTFNKISEIRQGVDDQHITKKYDIYYGLDRQRIKSVYTNENSVIKTRYYFGAYERTIQNNVIQEVDYISTPAGITAMRVYNDAEGLEKLYYLHTDNMGSVQAITDESKSIVSSYYYAPWGGRVLLSGANITDRGYTFHEHLEPFGLIDMNGRVYDPVLARFLSPDPYIQAPDYTQNFNRYSYGWNNPFKYTDPDGEWIWIVVGAVVGGTINVIIHADQIHNFKDGVVAFGIGAVGGALATATGGATLGAFGVGGFAGGAISAGIGYTYGTMFTSVGNAAYFGDAMPSPEQFAAGLVISMATGGIINGVATKLTTPDANFWTGKIPTPKPMNYLPTPKPKPLQTSELPEPEPINPYQNNNNNFTVHTEESPQALSIEGQGVNIQRPQINGYIDELSLNTDLYHNYPTSFDNIIVEHGSMAQRISDGAFMYTAPGTINGVQGMYTIGVNQQGVVFHRCFYEWSNFLKNF